LPCGDRGAGRLLVVITSLVNPRHYLIAASLAPVFRQYTFLDQTDPGRAPEKREAPF
jgi:hypothetical protein